MSDIKPSKTTPGKCSVPGCDWTGHFASFNRHAKGVGQGEKRRRGAHEDCDEDCECKFVPDERPSPAALSSYQQTMALLPPFDATKVHEHLRGEFHRRAHISQREYD
jgi:hypothetical protein